MGNYERMAEMIIPPIKMIGLKVTDLTYVIITKQVTLINQDPQTLNYGIYKSSLIDLNPLTDNAEGNKAQAIERCAA